MHWTTLFAVVAAALHASVATAENLPKLNASVPVKFKFQSILPLFDMDSDSCYPSAAISRKGEPNLGLQGVSVDDCRNKDFMDYSNTYHRYACQQINRNWLCGHMFALYFEKETAGSAHPHDFHYVVIWTMGLTVTHATAFSKGKPLTKPYMSTDVAKELNRVKFVFHEEGSSRHALRFADPSGDKTAENENGYFVLPAVVSWHTMQGEASIDNKKMIEKMNALGFENVPNPMADEHFLKNMNAGRPVEYPELKSASRSLCRL
ncbi:hypothetical protein Poli38472_009947 [Pythium oligandrum]|uniref:Uncharacterized protein n=1 Tax=Pythium oligandrum TaxID=41045 RepID=A0A8K1C8Z6_PYTOL|nr:hypothetical protein Poli38472_009947 [Pythium oligandrum]|eukprot:TMW58388.1 hypothetical protein Poli38472_009947 [Pythium oligandrum]